MNTKVLELEFQPETVAVVALDDTGRLLIPQVVTYTSIGGHDLGAVCNVVAGSLLCSVWDLCVYQVPSIALETGVCRSVYGIFRSSSPGEHLFIGYYGVMTIEEEEPPFLYREDGAGIVTPGGLTDQDRADGLEEEEDEGYVYMFTGEPDEGFLTFLGTIEDERLREQALLRWHWDHDHMGFVRWIRYKYKMEMDSPYVYSYYLNRRFYEDRELQIKLMREFKEVMDNLEDPYHLTY